MTQQKRTQLLARRSQRPHRRQTGTDQVAHRFVSGIRHPNRGQQPAPVQYRQAGGVALVVLLPVAAFARNHRGCDHHAVFPQLGEGTMILNSAVVLTRAKDLAPLCNCGLRFRRAQGALAGSADGRAETDSVLH